MWTVLVAGLFRPQSAPSTLVVAMFARYLRTIRTADGVAVMFTTLAFFLMVVVLMLAVIGDALWGYFQGR